jgi:hypothetical protein
MAIAMLSHAGSSTIIVEDAQLLFSGDYARRGADLVLSKDGHDHVIPDYFKGPLRKGLSSPDGATLSPDLVKALVGEVQTAQAGGAAGAAAQVIGSVSKLAGTVIAIRNGVSVNLNAGDNVQKGDVVQAGADSSLTLTFIDGTVFGLSANARMVLNEMVYDPNGSSNSSLLSLIQGTITFVAGETAKNGDMRVDTPVATMGIRGTAVLVEIGFEVPGQGAAPPAKFQVLVEPTGRTGSYVLYNKNTGAIMGTVNQAGQVTSITGSGDVNVGTAEPLTPIAQAIIQQTLQQYFPNYVPSANPRSNGGGGSTPSDPNSGTAPDPLKFAPLPEVFPGQPYRVPIKLPGFDINTPQIDVFVTRFNSAPTVTVASVVVMLPVDSNNFNIGERVTITDPDAGDTAIPYVPGTARIVSATGPAGTPASLDLKSLISVDPPTGRVSYDPALFKFLAAGQKAIYVIEFDSQSGPDTTHQTLTFTVDGTNDAPVATVALTGAVTQGGAPSSFDLLAGAADPDLGETATLSISNVRYSLDGSPAQPGAPSGVTLNGASLQVNPAAFSYLGEGQTATLVVSYTITDVHGASVTQSETITITGVNDQPVVVSTNFTVTPNDTVVLNETSFTISDPDASSNFVFTVTGVTGGYFEVGNPQGRMMMLRVNTNGPVTFTMNDLRDGHVRFVSDGSGPPSFTLTVDDGSGARNSLSTPTLQSPIYDDSNRAPTVNAPLTLGATEGMTPVSQDLLAGAVDRDRDTLSIANLRYDVGGNASTTPPAGVTINGTSVSVDPSNPAFNSLKTGQTLVVLITYDIIDGRGGSITQTETITITGTNDAPTITSASFCLEEGGTTLLKISDFCVVDPDNESFTFTATNVKHGKLQVLGGDDKWHDANSFTSADLAGNKVRFVHDGSEHDATFSITANDGDGGTSNIYRARIEIDHVNDAPTMIASPMIVSEGGTVVMTVLNFLVIDPDDNSFTFHVSDVNHGMFKLWNGHCWIDEATEFTTADLKAGRVIFVHDGSESPPSYTVYADDDHGNSPASNSVDGAVLFIPVNDRPLITHASFEVEPCSFVVLNASDFSVCDPDSSSFKFTVSNVHGGHFETLNYNYRTHCWEWSTDNSFTTSELNADRVRFVHDGHGSDISYDIRADDGSWVNSRSDKFHGGGTVIENQAPTIDISHLQTDTGETGMPEIRGITVADEDSANSSFHFATTTKLGGHVYFSETSSSGHADSLSDLNERLSLPITYEAPAGKTGQETVHLTVTDNKGASDAINFVFHVGDVSPRDHVTLTGTNGRDVIISTAAKDVLSGGFGADQFVFGPDFGKDSIADFKRGTDKIDLRLDIPYEPGETSFAHWLSAHTTTSRAGTTIHLDPHDGLGDHNTILVKGVFDLQASDFIVHDQPLPRV